LLLLPVAAKNGAISTIDAVFTSVSAVCVTGLIVLDTPHDFSFYGQFFILLLIQLGGLGIMTITTMALHAMGRRISLRQERLLITMTDTSHKELLGSLRTILYFTFTAEFVGAFILTVLFYSGGESFQSALWRGVFTSISAFCNAGFALQSDSLIPYQTNPLLLHTVGLLIILGGIAPAISLIIPKWLLRRPVPLAAEISLNMTAVLLVAGTIFMLIFEWNGFLSGLSLPDKIHNAWFQSLTLRTAGFNSVDISTLAAPSFLIMICFMFIGGSPGGTAGGVKTTTVAVLVMTFWANITGRQEVVFRRRRLPAAVISRAVTIISSGFIVWFLVVLMLEVTQQGVARDIIFEVTSALGTVGLSTGATAGLDEIGKIIIIFTMFIGRIGPMTLFMFLSDWRPEEGNCQYPEAKITLT
jgi:trk system potassium uptake protein TrkH